MSKKSCCRPGTGLWLAAFFLAVYGSVQAVSPVKLPPGMPEEGLTFYVRYDDQTEKAAVSGGKPESLNFKRTLQYEQAPGIISSGFRTFANETCLYEMKGNFDPKQGSLSFWVRPDNWKFRARAPALFVAEIPGIYRLLVRTETEKPHVALELSLPTQKIIRRVVGKTELGAGKWLRIDLTWDSARIRMFFDGLPVGEEALPKEAVLPDAADKGVISINPNGYFGVDAEALTTVDEVMVYNRVLPDKVFQESYSAVWALRTGVYRNPVVTVPYDSTAPVIDGVLAPEEWKNAALILAKNLGGRGRFSDRTGEIYLKYDATNIYFGFHAPDDATPLANIKSADGNVWEDGAFECICRPASNIAFQFVINSLNVVFDMLNGDNAWNGARKKTAAKTAVPDGGWSAEVALAFSELGVPVPKPGDAWRGNFMCDWDQRSTGYASWSVFIPEGKEGFFGNRLTFGALIFGAESTGTRLIRMGDLGAGAINALVASAGRAAERKVEFKLTSDRADTQVSNVNAKADQPAEYKQTVPAGTEGMLSITLKDGQGREEFVCDQAFNVQPPLVMTFKCVPSKNRMDVLVDMANASPAVKAKIKSGQYAGKVTLKDAAGKTAATADWILKGVEDKLSVIWEGILAPGVYSLQAVFPGGASYEQEKKFEVPSDAPFKAVAGVGHIVPDPWTPVKADKDRVYVLNREYVLDNSPFPAQFIVLGEELLTRPVRLNLTTGQGVENIAWGARRLVEKFDDKIVFAGEGQGSRTGIVIRWTAEVEFDGQWLARFTLETKDGKPVALEKMELDYALKSGSAEYVLATLLKPWQDNVIELDLFDKIESVVDRSSPMGGFWLTGHKSGLYVFTTTCANWLVPAKKPQVRIEKGEKETSVRITMINAPVKLGKPAAYVIGLTATPAKPRPVKNWAAGDHEYIFQAGPWQNWTSLVHMEPEKLRASMEQKRKKSIESNNDRKVAKYFYQYSFPGIIDTDPYYAFWGGEWSGNKAGPGSGCPNSTLKELLTYRVENLARDFGIGPYYDMCSITWCDNNEHGCGFVDSFGRPAKTMPTLGFRELMKRNYIIAHRYGCRNWNHHHSMFFPPAHTFSDLWFPGEQYASSLAGNNHFYSQGVTRDEYLLEMNPYIHGVNMLFLPEVGRAYDFAGEKDWQKYCGPDYAWYTEQLLAMLLPHDIDDLGAYMYGKPVEKIYELYRKHKVVVRDDAPETGGRFVGYWDNPAIKTDVAEVMLSYYVIPGTNKIVAVAGNPTLKARTARLTIDRKALGLTGTLAVRDEYRERDLPDWETKGVEIPAENFVILLIEGIGI